MYLTLQRFFYLVKHFALKEKTKTNILFLIPSPFIILKFAVLLQENEDQAATVAYFLFGPNFIWYIFFIYSDSA